VVRTRKNRVGIEEERTKDSEGCREKKTMRDWSFSGDSLGLHDINTPGSPRKPLPYVSNYSHYKFTLASI
jgi:hypothetical protein